MNANASGDIRILTNSSEKELSKRERFFEQFKNSPLPESEVLMNLGLFINRQNLSRILYMEHLYKQIVDVHGVVMEFGCRWGQNLSLFANFRGMYEPYNYYRKIIGFDTFAGFPHTHEKDGNLDIVSEGSFNVSENYQEFLENILDYHESESPISHIKKHELVAGDATKTVHDYLKKHPETIVALAYFDFDLYEPTKECLEAIKPHLTKGSVIGFDELSSSDWPGETIAFQEVLGINNFAVKRNPNTPTTAYLVFE